MQRDDGAVVGEAREIVPQGRNARGDLRLVVVQRPMALEIDIEAGARRGHQNVERLAGGGKSLGERAGERGRFAQGGR